MDTEQYKKHPPRISPASSGENSQILVRTTLSPAPIIFARGPITIKVSGKIMINVSIGVIKPLIIFGSTLSNHLYSGTAARRPNKIGRNVEV